MGAPLARPTSYRTNGRLYLKGRLQGTQGFMTPSYIFIEIPFRWILSKPLGALTPGRVAERILRILATPGKGTNCQEGPSLTPNNQ